MHPVNCRYIDLDCRAAAHRKWGCPEGIEAARLQAQAVAARLEATRGSREEQRRWAEAAPFPF
jgi:uncharacterized sporulation protein YeaH/YhbH (DUF444 family)